MNQRKLENKSEEFGVIVPRKTVSELLKIVKDAKNIQSEVEIFLSTLYDLYYVGYYCTLANWFLCVSNNFCIPINLV